MEIINISMTHDKVEGSRVGQCPLVTCFKGVATTAFRCSSYMYSVLEIREVTIYKMFSYMMSWRYAIYCTS